MFERICDSLDRKLIALLERDARQPTAGLARHLGVARTTVKERILRLEREGIIQGYSAIVRPDPNVQIIELLLFLSCKRPLLDNLVKQLSNLPEINSCVSVSGPGELMCAAQVPLMEDVDALVDEIAILDGVINIETRLILATKFEARSNQLKRRDHLRVVGN